MTELLGLPLEDALAALRARGVEPEVELTQSPRRPAAGRARVVRVSEDGRRIVAARFPDRVETEDDHEF